MFNKKYIQISKFIILSKKFIYLNNEKDDVNPIIIIYNVCNQNRGSHANPYIKQ